VQRLANWLANVSFSLLEGVLSGRSNIAHDSPLTLYLGSNCQGTGRITNVSKDGVENAHYS
jgi:hypothetical protein